MARLTHDGGWFRMDQDGEAEIGPNVAIVPMRLRARLWHPGFWLFALRTWLSR